MEKDLNAAETKQDANTRECVAEKNEVHRALTDQRQYCEMRPLFTHALRIPRTGK